MKPIKQNVQDSFFISLMQDKDILMATLQQLLPDASFTKQDIDIDLVEYIFATGIYNDLSVRIKNQMIVFMEAQSTWNENMPLRILMYIGEYYEKYIKNNKLNIYTEKPVELPMPKFYVIYTGGHRPKKSFISFQDVYPQCDSLNVKAEVISAQNAKGVLADYIGFCLNYKERYNNLRKQGHEPAQARQLAISLTIDQYQSHSFISAFITDRKKEVMSMLDILYNQEYVTKICLLHERREGKAEGIEEGIGIGKAEGIEEGIGIGAEKTKKEVALTSLQMGFPFETISKLTGYTEKELKILNAAMKESDSM